MSIVNVTFKNQHFGKIHARMLKNDIWYSGKDICRLLKLSPEIAIESRLEPDEYTRFQEINDDYSTKDLDLLVNSVGFMSLLELNRNESVANWFDYFIEPKSDKLISQMEGFEDNCKINVTYEG